MYEKYAELRDARNIRDADVARGTGISPSTFTDWKQGKSAPKLEKLLKIALFFGVPVEVFAKEGK